MSKFTPAEIEYLQSQRLGRLATVNEKGDPHVVPVGFRYNPELDTIDIGGHNIVQPRSTAKRYAMGEWPLSSMMSYHPGRHAASRCVVALKLILKGEKRS